MSRMNVIICKKCRKEKELTEYNFVKIEIKNKSMFYAPCRACLGK